jgi:hypothetical protein
MGHPVFLGCLYWMCCSHVLWQFHVEMTSKGENDEVLLCSEKKHLFVLHVPLNLVKIDLLHLPHFKMYHNCAI